MDATLSRNASAALKALDSHYLKTAELVLAGMSKNHLAASSKKSGPQVKKQPKRKSRKSK
jgi:hypothetical protein